MFYHPFLFHVGEGWELEKFEFALCSDLFWQEEDIIIKRENITGSRLRNYIFESESQKNPIGHI